MKRGARKALNGGGAGDAAVQYRNKTWRRDDATPSQEEEQQTNSQIPATFGNSTNGVNGLVRGDLAVSSRVIRQLRLSPRLTSQRHRIMPVIPPLGVPVQDDLYVAACARGDSLLTV